MLLHYDDPAILCLRSDIKKKHLDGKPKGLRNVKNSSEENRTYKTEKFNGF